MENQTVYFFIIITTLNRYNKLHGNQCMKNNTRNVETSLFPWKSLSREGLSRYVWKSLHRIPEVFGLQPAFFHQIIKISPVFT